ncbi:MAG: hypothetical protein HQK83_02760 [Fibrobacteria bacterium]|nr:hypothetical protein [Fibrobacteria bacterium]
MICKNKISLIILLSGLLFSALLSGCSDGYYMAMEGNSDETNDYDPFPKPLGDWIIPLSYYPHYQFHHAEFGKGGKKLTPFPAMPISITDRGNGLYGYEQDNLHEGLLLWFRTEPRDSSGIYITGRFKGTENFPGDTVLWLPQFPEKIGNWTFEPGRSMESLSYDTTYLTAPLFPSNDSGIVSQGNEVPFQTHEAILIKETNNDTISYYYFRKGIGLLGYERTYKDSTIAVGTLFSLNKNEPYHLQTGTTNSSRL